MCQGGESAASASAVANDLWLVKATTENLLSAKTIFWLAETVHYEGLLVSGLPLYWVGYGLSRSHRGQA